MARCHLSLSSLFIILEGEQHWSATIPDDPGRIFYELSLLQIKNPQILHMKNVN